MRGVFIENLVLATLTGAGLLVPVVAFATETSATAVIGNDTLVEQAAPAPNSEGDEIVVTGTLIRGIAPVGAPVVALDSSQIAATGISDATSVLRTVPQIVNLGFDGSKTGSGADSASSNNLGSSGINIRGLGNKATLTLVNGFRPAPGGHVGQIFDLAAIPLIALERLEILTDGSSAIYGSDAIAGVVNLILKRRHEGIDFRINYGFADNYHNWSASGITGFDWGSGGMMIAGEYVRNSELKASDRSELYIGADQGITRIDNSAPPVGFVNFTPNANIRVGSGASARYFAARYGAQSVADLAADQQNIVPYWYDSTIIPENERATVVTRFDQQIGDRVQLYGQGFFTERTVAYSGAYSAATSPMLTVVIPETNPYFIAGVPGVTTTQSVLLSPDNILGRAYADGSQRSWQAVIGGRYDISDKWELDLNVSHQQNRDFLVRHNLINNCALTGGSACSVPAGQIAGGAVAQTTREWAFNPFGANSQQVIDRLRTSASLKAERRITVVGGRVSGSAFSLPGGDVRIAAGAEYQHDAFEQLNLNGVPATTPGGFVSAPAAVSQQIWALYGELVIPLVGKDNAMPGAEKLDLSVAYRWQNYGLLDKATSNPKVGVTWRPVSDLSLNASYATSFRMSLIESTPTALAGINSNGAFPDWRRGTSVALTSYGGNEALKPEEARTITAGFNYRPDWAGGRLQIEATYFNIDYRNVIAQPGVSVFGGISSAAQEATYAPYILRRPSTLAAGADDSAFDARVNSLLTSTVYQGSTLDPATVAVLVDGRAQNAGQIKTEGLDFSLAHAIPIGAGRLNYGVSGSYYFNFRQTFTPGVPLTNFLDQIDFPTTYRLRGELGYQSGGFSANAFLNHVPSYLNTAAAGSPRVGAHNTVDLSVRYQFESSSTLPGLNLGVTVRDLFDAKPPYALVQRQTFDSNVASSLGRMISLQAGVTF